MEEIKISATIRDKCGSKKARRLRRSGFIPAILYGKGIYSIPITINKNEFKKIEKYKSAIISMDVNQPDKLTNYNVIIKDIQYNPLTDEVVHIDFQYVALDKPIITKVPIEIIGASIGEKEGGILQEVTREIEIECLPKDIPPKINVNISRLKIGDSIRVKDLELEDRIKILTNEDEVIVSVLAPEKVEEVAPPQIIEERKEPEVIREKKKEEE